MHQSQAASRDLEAKLIYEPTTTGVPELDEFVERGLITRVHAQLTSGKEGTVYCCRAHPSTQRKFIAAKVYREHAESSYKWSATYFEGRERVLKARTLRAIKSGTAFGKAVASGLWIGAEYDALQHLAAAGASTPVPVAAGERALLMEYIGNGAGPAPQLHGVEFNREGADRAFNQIMSDIARMLRNHVVHGDLSPYNILVWKEETRIIDLPQAVDARFNHAARELLQRDIENVCRFFAKHGIAADPIKTAMDLWEKYRRATL